MSKTQQLARLAELSKLMTDASMTRLQSAIAARDASLEALKRLSGEASVTLPEGLEGASEEISRLKFQVWAEKQRAAINIRLARQTAEVNECRSEAAQAFGRTRAVEMIGERQTAEARQKTRR